MAHSFEIFDVHGDGSCFYWALLVPILQIFNKQKIKISNTKIEKGFTELYDAVATIVNEREILNGNIKKNVFSSILRHSQLAVIMRKITFILYSEYKGTLIEKIKGPNIVNSIESYHDNTDFIKVCGMVNSDNVNAAEVDLYVKQYIENEWADELVIIIWDLFLTDFYTNMRIRNMSVDNLTIAKTFVYEILRNDEDADRKLFIIHRKGNHFQAVTCKSEDNNYQFVFEGVRDFLQKYLQTLTQNLEKARPELIQNQDKYKYTLIDPYGLNTQLFRYVSHRTTIKDSELSRKIKSYNELMSKVVEVELDIHNVKMFYAQYIGNIHHLFFHGALGNNYLREFFIDVEKELTIKNETQLKNQIISEVLEEHKQVVKDVREDFKISDDIFVALYKTLDDSLEDDQIIKDIARLFLYINNTISKEFDSAYNENQQYQVVDVQKKHVSSIFTIDKNKITSKLSKGSFIYTLLTNGIKRYQEDHKLTIMTLVRYISYLYLYLDIQIEGDLVSNLIDIKSCALKDYNDKLDFCYLFFYYSLKLEGDEWEQQDELIEMQEDDSTSPPARPQPASYKSSLPHPSDTNEGDASGGIARRDSNLNPVNYIFVRASDDRFKKWDAEINELVQGSTSIFDQLEALRIAEKLCLVNAAMISTRGKHIRSVNIEELFGGHYAEEDCAIVVKKAGMSHYIYFSSEDGTRVPLGVGVSAPP